MIAQATGALYQFAASMDRVSQSAGRPGLALSSVRVVIAIGRVRFTASLPDTVRIIGVLSDPRARMFERPSIPSGSAIADPRAHMFERPSVPTDITVRDPRARMFERLSPASDVVVTDPRAHTFDRPQWANQDRDTTADREIARIEAEIADMIIRAYVGF